MSVCRRLRCWLVVLAVWGLLAAGCSSGAPGGEGGSPVGGPAPAPPAAVEGDISGSGSRSAVSSTSAVPTDAADAVPVSGLGGVLSVEGLGRLRRVLGDEGLEGLVEEAELLAARVYRVRPTVEELSAYSRVSDLTEGGIVEIWPEEFEISLRDEDLAKVDEAMRVFLRGGEVRGILNAECKQRLVSERLERSCPDWVVEVVLVCGFYGPILERDNIFSCPVFPSEEALESGGFHLNKDCVLLVSEEELGDYIRGLGGGEDDVEEHLRMWGE